ncbi:MAG: peptidase U32 family protein [Candidatus Pacearchaeota archaeon]
MKNKKYELVAPAGDVASFIAAYKAGADAIYFGLKEFNMRYNAENFSLKDLEEIQKYPVKKYLTLNTIIFDNELKRIENIIKKVKNKIDAIICWDFAVINLCKKYNIPFHISTQASVANSEATKFYKKLGAKRIVLARELNLKQIKKISKIIEIECFIHGAMCISESGRCFTSQFLHGKSANRGQCLQPCRREYKVIDEQGNELKLKNNFVMSAKDLCTLPFFEKLKKAGIKAFKIEGRNRDIDYVDTVVRVYREAIDKNLDEKRKLELMKELEKVYNRKFSSGFYLGLPTADDFTNIKGSNTSQTKKIIGRIENYLTNKKVAIIKLFSDKLQLGDEILIEGRKTGLVRLKITSMQQNKKDINNVKKGEIFAILCEEKVRKNDSVFKIIDKNR